MLCQSGRQAQAIVERLAIGLLKQVRGIPTDRNQRGHRHEQVRRVQLPKKALAGHRLTFEAVPNPAHGLDVVAVGTELLA